MTQPEGREISFPTGHRRRDRSLPGATSLGEPSRGAPAPGGASLPPAGRTRSSSRSGQSQAVCPVVWLCFVIIITIIIIIIIIILLPYLSFLRTPATLGLHLPNEVPALHPWLQAPLSTGQSLTWREERKGLTRPPALPHEGRSPSPEAAN